MSQTPNEFYADRGLVRTSITLRPDTIQYLKDEIDKRNDNLDKKDTKLTQGELVDAFCALLNENANVKQLLENKINEIKVEKAKARQDMLDKKRKARAMVMKGELDEIINQ